MSRYSAFLFFFFFNAQLLPGQPILSKYKLSLDKKSWRQRCVQQSQDGFLLLGGNFGLRRFDGIEYKTLKVKEGNTEGSQELGLIYFIEPKKYIPNHFWLGSISTGLWLFDNDIDEFTHFGNSPTNETANPSMPSTGILEDFDGNLWMGGDHFALHYFDVNKKQFTVFRPDMPDGFKGTLEKAGVLGFVIEDRKDNNYIWVGSRFGPYRFNKRDKKFEFFPFEKTKEKHLHLPLYLYMDKHGMLWTSGLNEGLFKLNSTIKEWKNWILTPLEQAVDNINSVRGFVEINDTTLFAVTARNGFYQININQETIESKLTPSEVLNTDVTTSNRIYKDKYNNLWIPNHTSMYLLTQPQNINNEDKMVPSPYFKEFLVNGIPLNLKQYQKSNNVIELLYNQNKFSIEFGAINFNLNPENSFAYQLVGHDADWIPCGKQRHAVYANLPPGQYQFRLKATNRNDVWSKNIKSLNIFIRPLFYQTLLFKITSAAFLIGLLTIIYFVKITQIKKAEHLKTEFHKQLNDKEMSALRAQMNPHFLFNSLNSINWYIIKKKPRQASRYLTKFSRLMRLVLENSKSKKIPLEHELQALKLYMEMEALRFENKFNYEIIISENIDEEEVEVPPLILQPYVENAIWHGLMNKKGKGNLSIHISEKNNQLHCIIEDNGIGREAAAELKKATVSQNRARGMEITSSRISMMKNGASGQSVQIIDLKDKMGNAMGTRVELYLPMD